MTNGQKERQQALDTEIVTPISRINKTLAGSLETGRVSHAYLFSVLDSGFASSDYNATSVASGAIELQQGSIARLRKMTLPVVGAFPAS